jgi:hypothetical protein
MLRPIGFSVFALFVAIMPTTSFASNCDSFNLLRFDPSELQNCIKEMQFKLEMQEKMNRLLEGRICTLAMELAEANPTSLNERIANTDCQKEEPAKRGVSGAKPSR